MNWIKMTDRKPASGQTVITHHFLRRIDMLKYDGTSFHFPLTCPVDKDGNPLGPTASYPADAITHWMDLPSFPNKGSTRQEPA